MCVLETEVIKPKIKHSMDALAFAKNHCRIATGNGNGSRTSSITQIHAHQTHILSVSNKINWYQRSKDKNQMFSCNFSSKRIIISLAMNRRIPSITNEMRGL